MLWNGSMCSELHELESGDFLYLEVGCLAYCRMTEEGLRGYVVYTYNSDDESDMKKTTYDDNGEIKEESVVSREMLDESLKHISQNKRQRGTLITEYK